MSPARNLSDAYTAQWYAGSSARGTPRREPVDATVVARSLAEFLGGKRNTEKVAATLRRAEEEWAAASGVHNVLAERAGHQLISYEKPL